MTIEIRPASGYADLERWVATRNEVAPDDPESTTMMALIRASELEHVNLLALLDGEAVGFAALLHVEDGHFGVHRITVVLPAWRRARDRFRADAGSDRRGEACFDGATGGLGLDRPPTPAVRERRLRAASGEHRLLRAAAVGGPAY